jgi:hypothetical protein
MTMAWLLGFMLKEEFRVHASYSGRTMFVSFPFIITMFALSIAVTSGRLLAYTSLADAILLLHVSVFLYGLSVGAFGCASDGRSSGCSSETRCSTWPCCSLLRRSA